MLFNQSPGPFYFNQGNLPVMQSQKQKKKKKGNKFGLVRKMKSNDKYDPYDNRQNNYLSHHQNSISNYFKTDSGLKSLDPSQDLSVFQNSSQIIEMNDSDSEMKEDLDEQFKKFMIKHKKQKSFAKRSKGMTQLLQKRNTNRRSANNIKHLPNSQPDNESKKHIYEEKMYKSDKQLKNSLMEDYNISAVEADALKEEIKNLEVSIDKLNPDKIMQSLLSHFSYKELEKFGFERVQDIIIKTIYERRYNLMNNVNTDTKNLPSSSDNQSISMSSPDIQSDLIEPLNNMQLGRSQNYQMSNKCKKSKNDRLSSKCKKSKNDRLSSKCKKSNNEKIISKCKKSKNNKHPCVQIKSQQDIIENKKQIFKPFNMNSSPMDKKMIRLARKAVLRDKIKNGLASEEEIKYYNNMRIPELSNSAKKELDSSNIIKINSPPNEVIICKNNNKSDSDIVEINQKTSNPLRKRINTYFQAQSNKQLSGNSGSKTPFERDIKLAKRNFIDFNSSPDQPVYANALQIESEHSKRDLNSPGNQFHNDIKVPQNLKKLKNDYSNCDLLISKDDDLELLSDIMIDDKLYIKVKKTIKLGNNRFEFQIMFLSPSSIQKVNANLLLKYYEKKIMGKDKES